MKFIIDARPDLVPALVEALEEAGIPFDPKDDMVVTDEHYPMEYRMVPIAFGNEAQELTDRMNEYLKELEITPLLPQDTGELDLEQRQELLDMAVNEMSWSKNAVLEAIRIEDEESGWPWVMKSYPALFGKA